MSALELWVSTVANLHYKNSQIILDYLLPTQHHSFFITLQTSDENWHIRGSEDIILI